MGWGSPPRSNRDWYVPPTGRGRGLGLLSPPPRPHVSSNSFPHPRSEEEADTQPGRERGLQTSLPRRGRGLLAVFTGRERGLRLACPPGVGRSLDVPRLGRRRGLRAPSPHHPGSPHLLWWEAELEQVPYCRSGQGVVE